MTEESCPNVIGIPCIYRNESSMLACIPCEERRRSQPIVTLPKDLIVQIFIVTESLKDIASGLRTCRQWYRCFKVAFPKIVLEMVPQVEDLSVSMIRVERLFSAHIEYKLRRSLSPFTDLHAFRQAAVLQVWMDKLRCREYPRRPIPILRIVDQLLATVHSTLPHTVMQAAAFREFRFLDAAIRGEHCRYFLRVWHDECMEHFSMCNIIEVLGIMAHPLFVLRVSVERWHCCHKTFHE